MRGRGKDLIDQLCERWASVRRKVLGITETIKSSEVLGSPHCTMAEKQILTGTSGNVNQHFPEVYVGDNLVIHRAFRSMPYQVAKVFEVHYIIRAPQREKAEALGLSQSEYSQRKAIAKHIVESFLNAEKNA